MSVFDSDPDPFDVFDIEQRSDEAHEHLADPIDANTATTIEITINLPRDREFKKLSMLQQVNLYRDLWEHLVEEAIKCNKKVHRYEIEYCQDKFPHLHGYITYYNLPVHYPEGLLHDITRYIYLKLDKKYWKHYGKREFNASILRMKTPAVCLNYKNVLHSNWIGYITKNAQ